MLVTNLCRNASVPEIARIDEYRWANQVMDIINIQDEMNSKLKKRKRDPIITHISKVAMALDPYTRDDIAIEISTPASTKTLSSSSGTLVAPQPTQSFSGAQMIQVEDDGTSSRTLEEANIATTTSVLPATIRSGRSVTP
ncbi:hypothetical protein HAX54_001890 [Datura stramonium]|uniref:Uncharacterized protein n=1 Tax=Datura stramonium TaxID=4076 RepID=A0ABS8RTH0_DATST|nr:hypothetical protein [Datura stramonium]